MRSQEKPNRRLMGFVALLTSLAFLLFSSGCSHSPRTPPAIPAPGNPSAEDPPAGGYGVSRPEEPWWKKDENQWLMAALIVLGVGIATSAAIFVSFGGGGLSVAIRK